MGMVYHPQRAFGTIGALYFSVDHTLGLLLERSLDCVMLLYCLLFVYLDWKFCSFCCTFLYLNSQPVLGILQPILKSLFPAQRGCVQQGLLDLPGPYQGNQADISVSCGAFHLSPFFGQRKLNTDECTEQKEHVTF